MLNNRKKIISHFIRICIIDNRRRTTIVNIRCIEYCFSPKHRLNIRKEHHRSNHIKQSSIHTFCNAILLWIISCCSLVFDSIVIQILFKNMRSILTTVIGSENFYVLLIIKWKVLKTSNTCDLFFNKYT